MATAAAFRLPGRGSAFEDDPFGQFRLQHLFCKAIQYRHVSPLVFVEEVRVDSFDGFIDDVFRNEAGNADFRSGNDFDIDAVVTEDAEHAGSDARMAGHASTDDGNFCHFVTMRTSSTGISLRRLARTALACSRSVRAMVKVISVTPSLAMRTLWTIMSTSTCFSANSAKTR